MAGPLRHDITPTLSEPLPPRRERTRVVTLKSCPRPSLSTLLPYPPNWVRSSRGLIVCVIVICFCSPCLAMKSILSFDCYSLDDKRTRQTCLLQQARVRCTGTISTVSRPSDGGVYCNPTFDNVMCWSSYVPAGKMVTQPCADYVDGFNPKEHAVRNCTPNGTWEIHPDDKINTSWTDFNSCRKKQSSIDPILEENMPIIITISTIGYSVSLAFLIVAMVIMLGFKKLLCQRNIIHINLFVSFILRAVIALIRHGVFVDGVALPKDIIRADDDSIMFTDGPHWECKLIVTLMHYSLGANYMWIFVEGLYLHNLIFFAVFWQSKTIFRIYIFIGWFTPLFFVIIWVFLRSFVHDSLCWNTHVKDLYWILETPIIVSIGVNFIFFLNIIRVLFLKIRDCNTQDPRRYKKLAKSTLVLMPLFGVYYIIFILMDKYKHPNMVIIYIYSEMILNSFQGTVISLLFCFLNGEVQGEIKKHWQRHWLRRQSVISGRSSRAFSTTSFLLRDRASVTQTQMTSDISRLHSNGSTPPRSPSRAHWTMNNGDKQQSGGDKTDSCGYLSNGDAGGIARTSSVPQWPSSSSPANGNNNKDTDLHRVASTSKVTFQLDDTSSTSGTRRQNRSPSPSAGSVGHNNTSDDNTGETRHLLSSDHGVKSIPFNGLTPRIVPYPSSFRKGPVGEPSDSRKGEKANGIKQENEHNIQLQLISSSLSDDSEKEESIFM